MRSIFLTGALVILFSVPNAASAGITFIGSPGGFVDNQGVTFNQYAIGSSPTGVLIGGTGSFSGTGTVRLGTTATYAEPFGDTTKYFAIQANQHETITFGVVQNYFSLFLGSADEYNTFDFFLHGQLQGHFNGKMLLPPGNGDQFSAATNGNVRFYGPFDTVVLGTGNTNALEFDNVTASVPEPATWGMMLVGFAALGLLASRRRSVRDRMAPARAA